MVNTFEALAIVVIAMLPGALYVWGFEREVGQWGISASDRLLRFVGTSTLLHALAAPASFWIWDRYIRSGRVADGDVPLGLWPVVFAYVALPALAGIAVGISTRDGRRWAQRVVGSNPSPRAWDHLFHRRPAGVVRLKLKSGAWAAGLFADGDGRGRSYAAGYPHPQDLWLSASIEVDHETGAFPELEEGGLRLLDSGLLIRFDEVELLEFIPTPKE